MHSQRRFRSHEFTDLDRVPRIQMLGRGQGVVVERDPEDASQEGEGGSGRDGQTG